MKLILEGADGSGKSTLGKILSKKFNADLIHVGGPKQIHLIDEYFNRFHKEQNVIYDRCQWISDFVYSKIYNRQLIKPTDVLKLYWEYPQTVIFCTGKGPISEEHKAHKTKEELEKVKQERDNICQEYLNLIDEIENYPNSQIRVIEYDFRYQTLDDLICEIQK